MNHLIDVVRLDKLMTKDFDFKHYYCEYGKYEMRDLVELTKKNVAKLWFYSYYSNRYKYRNSTFDDW